jgi:small subunit ribosomal protein S5
MLKKVLLFVIAILLVTLGLTFTNRFAHLKNFATWGVHTIHDYKTHPVRVVVIGDENGQVGIGIAKAEDVVNAFKKAKSDARKHLIKIPVTKTLSVPHTITGNFGACKIIIKPAVEGSGVIAGGAVRTVLEVAGIKNVIAKQLGSDNLLNNAQAAICGLKTLTTKAQVSKNRDIVLK